MEVFSREKTTYRIEDRGAVIVVQVRVDIVNTNGVDTKVLHDGSVTEAEVLVGQRVHAGGRRVARATARLVSDTNDLVTVASRIVDEVTALDFDGGDGSGQRGSTEQAQDGSEELRHDCQFQTRSGRPLGSICT